MKKILALALILCTVSSLVIGCGSTQNNDKINLISREEGSGTRGAFIELFGIETKDDAGNKIDNTLDSAEITNNTAVMITSIASDEAAIGYISLGSLNDTVKALEIDGSAPTIKTIKDGTYSISRPFIIAISGNVAPITQNFIDFIMSTQGQAIVEKNGYISIDNPQPFTGIIGEGKTVVAGSSSVTPVMEALKEAYEAINSNGEIEIQQSDSTTGMNSVIEGICDIGMASRNIKDSELSQGLLATVIAIDGIAVIVNNNSQVNSLSKDQVQNIYTGKISTWRELQ